MTDVNADRANDFTHTIRVGWADCDPAKIAYTGRIPCFALDSIDAWWEAQMGADWFELNIDRNIGLPFVHINLDFRKPVTPREKLLCRVRLLQVGQNSIRFQVSGSQAGATCFVGEFVEAFVDAGSFEKVAMPDAFRDKLELLVS